MNQFNFIGRLTDDPKRTDYSGGQIAKFTAAWNDRKKAAHFFKFEAFGKTAELIQTHLKKGDQAGFSCYAKQNRWDDKDGNKRSETVFIVNELTFIGGSQKAPAKPVLKSEALKGAFGGVELPPDDFNDDLPF